MYSVPRPATMSLGFAPFGIERGQVLADGAAVVEPHAGIDRQAVAYGDGVARKRRGRDELAADVGRIARDRPEMAGRCCRRTSTPVGMIAWRVVLALFELRAELPLVIGAEQRRAGSD